MELLRTRRLLLRSWEDSDLLAFFDVYSREDVMRWLGPHPRWFGLTTRQYRKTIGPDGGPSGLSGS
jgi:hypothetical protein